jgi:mono/diheme cytochrome c family protein
MKYKFVLLAIGTSVIAVLLSAAAVMRVNSMEQSVIESISYNNLKGDTDRGAYVAIAGGCIACHTDKENGGEILAGGAPLDTPFGTFHAPNITSHTQAGIGNWTLGEFVKAMVIGRSPDGAHYYPVFPYTSYTAMSPQDLVDLKSWLDTVEPVSSNAAPHELSWPFTLRVLLVGWKAMFFNTATELDPADRGEYLVSGPSHCAECHANRNLLGGISDRSLTGNLRGPDGNPVPGISASDLEQWTKEDLTFFLEIGMTLEGDLTGGHMSDIIEYSTSQLTSQDRDAIADFLLSEGNSP